MQENYKFVYTVRSADAIIAMDKGRIVERGTHEQLIRRNGLYGFLHKQQKLLGGGQGNPLRQKMPPRLCQTAKVD